MTSTLKTDSGHANGFSLSWNGYAKFLNPTALCVPTEPNLAKHIECFIKKGLFATSRRYWIQHKKGSLIFGLMARNMSLAMKF